METLLGKEGAYLDAIYYCPHHPHKGYEGERPELSECSAVVRLQVVHPVPAFFIFQNFLKNCIPKWLCGFLLV